MKEKLGLLRAGEVMSKLTQREYEVMTLLLRGASNKLIGQALFISIKTVEFHVSNIFQKLGVRNRMELINRIIGNDPLDWHKN